MDKKLRQNYEKAGAIHQSAVAFAQKKLKPETPLLGLAVEIEDFIFGRLKEEKLDGGLAFPLNLSLNNVAAHFTPGTGDKTVLGKDDVLKVDIGVHVKGCIADGAFTFNYSNKHEKQIELNNSILQSGLDSIKVGSPISVVGNAIGKIMEKTDFKTIENLTGHGLGVYLQHDEPQIPNQPNNLKTKITDGMALAIEPFVTTGRGFVAEASQVEIFSIEEPKPVRDMNARKLLDVIGKHWPSLPFAERQLAKETELSEFARKVGLRELSRNKILHAYPVLQEQKDAIVTQSEKTVLIDGDEVKIIN
ncbi:MAG: type II methionyl aminopeptidase [Candidatus Micrarchaeota archaeon]